MLASFNDVNRQIFIVMRYNIFTDFFFIEADEVRNNRFKTNNDNGNLNFKIINGFVFSYGFAGEVATLRVASGSLPFLFRNSSGYVFYFVFKRFLRPETAFCSFVHAISIELRA